MVFRHSTKSPTGYQITAHIALPTPNGGEFLTGNERGKHDLEAFTLDEKVMRIPFCKIPLNDRGKRIVPVTLNQPRTQLSRRVLPLGRSLT